MKGCSHSHTGFRFTFWAFPINTCHIVHGFTCVYYLLTQASNIDTTIREKWIRIVKGPLFKIAIRTQIRWIKTIRWCTNKLENISLKFGHEVIGNSGVGGWCRYKMKKKWLKSNQTWSNLLHLITKHIISRINSKHVQNINTVYKDVEEAE